MTPPRDFARDLPRDFPRDPRCHQTSPRPYCSLIGREAAAKLIDPPFTAHALGPPYASPQPLEFETMDAPFMRAMISHCRKFEPSVPQEVSEYIVDE